MHVRGIFHPNYSLGRQGGVQRWAKHLAGKSPPVVVPCGREGVGEVGVDEFAVWPHPPVVLGPFGDDRSLFVHPLHLRRGSGTIRQARQGIRHSCRGDGHVVDLGVRRGHVDRQVCHVRPDGLVPVPPQDGRNAN